MIEIFGRMAAKKRIGSVVSSGKIYQRVTFVRGSYHKIEMKAHKGVGGGTRFFALLEPCLSNASPLKSFILFHVGLVETSFCKWRLMVVLHSALSPSTFCLL